MKCSICGKEVQAHTTRSTALCARAAVKSVFRQSRSPVGSTLKEWATFIERGCFYIHKRRFRDHAILEVG